MFTLIYYLITFGGSMKTLILMLTLSLYSFAHDCPPDVSSFCFQEMRASHHSRSVSIKFCRDVSNTCYMEFRNERNKSIKFSKNKCHNVSNNCFTDVDFYHNDYIAARACNNVNNNCYTLSRRHGFSVKKSIKKCEDVYMDCRVCDLLDNY